MKRPGGRLRRVLLKVSGEGLAGEGRFLDERRVAALARELRGVVRAGTEVAVVVGGGNVLRGKTAEGLDRGTADRMGMLATVQNGLALRDLFEARDVPARVLAPAGVSGFCETFEPRACRAHLEQGRVCLLVGGTGQPFFSTDTAAALRACEIGAQRLLKATKVDGVYSADPCKDPSARRYDVLDYDAVLAQGLEVMDLAAVVLCRENRIPIQVFSLGERDALTRACRGARVGTLVGPGP